MPCKLDDGLKCMPRRNPGCDPEYKKAKGKKVCRAGQGLVTTPVDDGI